MPSTIGLYSGGTAPEVAGNNTTSLYGGAGVPVPGSNGNTVVRGNLTVTGDANIQGELTVGDDVCIEGDTITLRCKATTTGNAQIIAYRGGGTNLAATITWDESVPVPPGAEPSGRWVANCGFDAAGVRAGNVNIGPDAFDNLISTYPGSAVDLLLDSDTGQIRFNAEDLRLSQNTTFLYSEAGDRANRPNVQSTTGNISGFRVIGPNTSSSSTSVIGAFTTSDINNGTALNFITENGGTDPLRVGTATYTGGVVGFANQSINFYDYTNKYASVNPAGPTDPTDLTTKAWVENYVTGGAFVFQQINIDNRAIIDTATATLNAGANQVLDTWPIATYGSVKYQIQARSAGVGTQASEIMVVQNTINAFSTEYAIIVTGGNDLYSNLQVDISGGNVRLLVDVGFANTVFKAVRTAVTA